MTAISIDTLRDLYKLKSIFRYNNRQKLKTESVAEHSYFVAAISMQLCKKYKLSSEIMKNCLIRSLLHDMPEIVTGDIPYDSKVMFALHEKFNTFEQSYFELNFAEFSTLMSKNDDISALVVDVADALSVVQFADNEIRLGNSTDDMRVIYDESFDRCRQLLSRLDMRLAEKN